MEQFDEQGNVITTPTNSVDRETQYKNLQAGFTKQAQELAELRKSQSNQSNETDWEAWKQWIKENVLDPELQKLKGNLTAEQEFKQLIDANPQLRAQEKAIKEIANLKWLAYEDVIQEYWFLSEDKLQKAKERSLIWDRTLETQPKSVRDLSESEWKELERSNKNVWAFSQLQSI